MENIKVLDEKGNPVVLMPFKAKAWHILDAVEIRSVGIDSIEYAKDIVTKHIASEIRKNLFFTEKENEDGSITIQAETIFYGI